ncbi:SCO family protein [Lysobacter sp. MMG2]|uniref:SCO family protein n=1 Tax=Lysobacter sp. MMG2 TaxID=2801338 RepID=UPI001C247FBF|nr:SCO family protein [Lysobacter sp. MMG2]MBU8975768.1 SCO family protein [Lysobacter sp. MMG2]
MRRAIHALVLGAAMLLSAMPALAQRALPGDSIYQVQATMTDQSGRHLAWHALRGRPTVVSMFYAGCHVMCPLIIGSGKSLQTQLTAGEQARLDFAMISIDPARDTPAVLADVARQHRLDTRRWRLLQPQARDVRTLSAALGVRYRAQADGSFSHTSVLILLDGDGREVARSQVESLQPDPAFVATVRAHLATLH